MPARKLARDPADANRAIDLLTLASGDVQLRRVTAAGEYAGPCPFCRDGSDRFHVHQREGWWFCRQCSPKRGDALSYVMRREGLTYPQAWDQLTGAAPAPDRPERKEGPLTPLAPVRILQPPPPAWQAAALDVLDECADQLDAALPYLAKRGIAADTARAARLGYVRGSFAKGEIRYARLHGHDVPEGILLPWLYRGEVWQLKVRRRSGLLPKYLAVSGGHPFLYVPVALPDAGPLVLVEGEFDALLLHQELHGLAAVASLGSASVAADGLPPGLRDALSAYDPLLVVGDNDAAGMQLVSTLQRLMPQVRRMPVPFGNDVTEYWQSGAKLIDWVRAYLRLAELPLVPTEADDEPPSPVRDPLRCDAQGCALSIAGSRDDVLGGWCAEHWFACSLLGFAEAAGWPTLSTRGRTVIGREGWWTFATDCHRDQAEQAQRDLDALLEEAVGE